MKKVIYGLILIFCLFIGIDNVKAKEVTKVCYYSGADGKLSLAAKVYDNGSSADLVLIKTYSKDDGFRENQKKYEATWSISKWNGSDCASYIKYSMNNGTNSAEVVSSKGTDNKVDYYLTKYDFKSIAYKCYYEPVDDAYKNISLQVLASKDGSIVWGFNDLNDFYSTPPNDGYFINVESDFGKDFLDNFETDGKYACPTVTANFTGDQMLIYPYTIGIDGAIKFNNTVETTPSGTNISDSSDGIGATNSYTARLSGVVNTNGDVLVTFIKNNGLDYIQTEVDGAKTTPEKVETSSGFFQTTVSSVLYLRISPEQQSKLFAVDSSGKIISQTVYFNKMNDISGGGTYYYEISTSSTDDSISSADSEAKYGILSGQDYSNLVCHLAPLVKASTNYTSSLGTDVIDFSHCSGTYSGSSSNLEYYTTVALKNLATYCNDLYDNYDSYKSSSSIDNRMKECINFDTFYDNLVKAKVINDLSSGCGFMSNDLQKKVVWILNIIKIAGPILAIALGALDFVKVIASGEADKEMKTAGKRLLRRFIAAILLFIIPIILAWLMDTVLGDENGYEAGNPFCGTVNWSETK